MTKVSDLYTKIVLTVIAVSLVYIVTKDIHIIPEAVAQYKSSQVMDVNIARINGLTFGPRDVNIHHPALPVRTITNEDNRPGQ
ncbi:hypothetical protein ACFLQL_00975 [Verrucomicrobiota bacterium]